MMNGALVSAATQIILEKAVSLAAEEISLVWGLEGDLISLKESVTMIQTVLDDAEKRQVTDGPVNLWLERLKDISHKADDVLDEFSYEILRRKVEIRNQMRRKVCFLCSIGNPLAFRYQMGHRIKNITSTLAKINREAIDFRLQGRTVDMNPPQVRENRETHSFLEGSEVVGRENDASNIIEMLIRPRNQEVSVIPIVGMAGHGKTTLAKLIYHDEKIKRQFDARIWVCVSDNFDVKKLLTEILESFTERKCEVASMEGILKHLQKEFGGKKILLILDDVWNEDPNKWDDFKSHLLGVGTSWGNSILVTTRSIEVATIVKTIPEYYNVKKLSDEDCWSIFKEKAFKNGGVPMTIDLVRIGRAIVEKCNGVPLAAKVAGSIMRSKKEKHEWVSILNDGIWNLVGRENGIFPILKLSFDHLPSPSLKQCFAYCSIFTKDFRLEKEQLIQHWMAQGFLQPNDQGSNMVMEDKGNEYFNILLQSSLFQDIEKDDFECIKYCKMHDLVHELAQSISKSECIIQEVDRGIEIPPRVRHLALYFNCEIIDTMQQESAERLRTLFLESIISPHMFLKFRYLRILSFRGADVKELPSSIRQLIHLRYLDLSHTNIKVLPNSVANLYNLQTIRVQECYDLQKLPKCFRNLISLRHFYFDDNKEFEMPLEIGQLTCLQTLPFFNVGVDKGRQIEELGYLRNLRGELEIRNLERVKSKEEAQKADIFGKKNIYKLKYVWTSHREGNTIDEDVLECLQPSPNLKGLEIQCFLGNNFPSWMMKMRVKSNETNAFLPLDNLEKIKLEDCQRCEQIPMLGQLPLLRHLELNKINNVQCIGASFYGPNHGGNDSKALFPALTRFKLQNMPSLEEWMEAAIANVVPVFPCLEVLHIVNCPKLKSAPSHFPCLKELKYDTLNSNSPLEKICSRKLTTLTDLIIRSVSGLTSLPDELFQSNKYLINLEIDGCPRLNQFVPHVIGCNNSLLRSLKISYCQKLQHFSDDLQNMSSLETLHIVDCPNLKSVPSINGLTSLRDLRLSKCDRLTCLPSGLHSCTSLDILSIHNCPDLISFPDIQGLRSLSFLLISDCKKLTRLPNGLHCLTYLTSLNIGRFSEDLNSFPSLEGVQHLKSSLGYVILHGWPHWDFIPPQLQYLTGLKIMIVDGFGVKALPDWFGNLSSLERLRLLNCHKLMYLPGIEAMQRLTKLERLEIQECPILKTRCAKLIGAEWSKIGHIPAIMIDGEDFGTVPYFGAVSKKELQLNE